MRGARRRKAVDRGFALSDHADWPGLLAAIAATGAPRVLVTHGYREPLVRWLSEQGVEARAIASAWEGESASEESGGAEAESSPASGVHTASSAASGSDTASSPASGSDTASSPASGSDTAPEGAEA